MRLAETIAAARIAEHYIGLKRLIMHEDATHNHAYNHDIIMRVAMRVAMRLAMRVAMRVAMRLAMPAQCAKRRWQIGEQASWRVGEQASWRVGEQASWRVGEQASRRAGELVSRRVKRRHAGADICYGGENCESRRRIKDI